MRRELVLLDICSKSAIDSLRVSATCNHVYCPERGLDYILHPVDFENENASNLVMGGFIGDKEFIGTFQRIFRAEPRSIKTGVHNP